MEWNGKYRDAVRKFWKGDMGLHGEIATRLAGSADLYEATRRPPSASVNFVTAHDGFTLQDLVSYEQKHNEANGEENRDGADDNHTWNCGAEGPTDDERSSICASGRSATYGAADLRAGIADDLRRRRVEPHPAGQQQRLLPGFGAVLVSLGLPRAPQELSIRVPRGPIPQEAPDFHRYAFYDHDPDADASHKNIVWFRAE